MYETQASQPVDNPEVGLGTDRRDVLRRLLGFVPLWVTFATPREVAIILHRQNPLRSVSLDELERIFRLRQERWPDGQRIYLVMQEEGSFQKRIVLERIYGMTNDELKRFWLAKIYRGEMTSFPKTFVSDASVLRFVSRVPNAIGFIDSRRVDASVRVLGIEGRRPGENGYRLRESAND